MCVAAPMRVISVDKPSHTAIVEIAGGKMPVNISLIDPSPGDFVLVHVGCALEIVRPDTAAEIWDIYNELAESIAE